jgi:D-tyrosyl-tRNA(Tyr) deacylase
MRIVIQRVSEAKIVVDEKLVASIGKGFLVLLGIETEDTQADADWLVKKLAALRVFSDENGMMNKNIQEVNGALLIVSQFTLHASYKKGNRPSFIKAARPEQAIPLYEYFIRQTQIQLPETLIATGIFGADMKVSLTNDGPVTISMDSKNPT